MKFNLQKIFIAICFISLAFAGCKKEYESIEELDEKNIQAYIQQNNLKEMQQYDTSGVYYQVVSPGVGAEVKNTDKVFVTYSIKTLSGEYVSDDENVNRFLNYLGYLNPEPWRIGIGEVLKKKGGTIRLIIPSRKGFGRNGSGSIPSNASLDCTLKLYDVNNQIEFEDVFVKKYIQQNNITGLTRLNTGVYYQIISPGTGDPVELTSTISAAYTGKLTNGTVFDSATASSPLKTTLNGVILGWQEILPLIKKGGKIRAIIPPARAYGSSARGDIPPNSILDFEIELVDVTN